MLVKFFFEKENKNLHIFLRTLIMTYKHIPKKFFVDEEIFENNVVAL